MAEYHVGCGIAGIYAGTLKKNGIEWLNKTCVTVEAVHAVRDWLLTEMDTGANQYGYQWKMKDGRTLELLVRIRDKEETA